MAKGNYTSKIAVDVENYTKSKTIEDNSGDGNSGNSNNELLRELSTSSLVPFKNHPYKIREGREFEELKESIKQNGILQPIICRKVNDKYEIISGHTRWTVAKSLELEKVPVDIREFNDADAIIAMVDSNIQREEILPSERAFAYKMKLEAINQRRSLRENNGKRATDELAENDPLGWRQISTYISFTKLIPELLDMLDNKELSMRIANSLSEFSVDSQKYIYEAIKAFNVKLSSEQIRQLKSYESFPDVTEDEVYNILNSTDDVKEQKKIILTNKEIYNYFPKKYTVTQINEKISKYLENWETIDSYLDSLQTTE